MQLYDYQKQGIQRLFSSRRLILADEMGLGKTVQAILSANAVKQRANRPIRVLICVPAVVKHNWKREIKQWLGTDDVTLVAGNFEQREALLKKPSYFTIVNFEQFRAEYHKSEQAKKLIADGLLKIKRSNKDLLVRQGMLTLDEGHLPTVLKQKYDVIIVDEAHRLSNRQSMSFQAMDRVIKANPGNDLYLLTGTPVLNKPSDLWALLHLIDPKTFSSFWRWVKTYCDTQPSFWNPQIQEITALREAELLRKDVAPYILRREKADVLSLPEKVYQDFEVELEPTQLRMYEKMQKDMWVALENGEVIEAPSILAKLIRLKQLSVSPDLLSPADPTLLRGAKIDALLNVLEDSGNQKVVIFSQFAEVIRRLTPMLEKLYPDQVSGFTGDLRNYKERQRRIDVFQSNPKTKIFLLTIQAGGIGITLTAGTIAMFTDVLWTPALNGQAVDRLHRIGQRAPVTIVTLSANNTIDQHIQKILDKKQAMFDATISTSQVLRAYAQAVLKGGLK
jgi:SNF2 family DNA or RNA helicase